MNFVLPKSILESMVGTVSVALTKKPMIQSQSYIVFRTFDNGLLLSTMGADLSVQIFEGVPMPPHLEFAVDGFILSDIVERLQGDEVEVELNKDMLGLKISSKGTTVNMKIIGVESFPIMHNYQHMPFTVTRGLLESIKTVAFAVSKDDNRPQLQGVLVNETEIVSTDGYRMAIKEHGNNLEGLVNSKQFDTIVSTNSVDKLSKIFKNPELGIFSDDSSIHFNSGNIAASIRKIDKPYPKYKNVVPISGYDILKVRRLDLIKALEFVQIADDTDSVNLDLSDNLLRAWTTSEKLSNIEHTIEASYNNKCELMFNPQYLLDVAKRIKDDTISIEVRGASSPLVIKEDGTTYVVMPKLRK